MTPVPEPTEALIAVAPLLRARLPELSAAIVDRVERSMPMYGDVRAVEAGSLERSVRRNVEYLLATVTAEGDADLAAPIETGRVRANQGVPLAEMLRTFRIGFALFWEAVADEVIRDGRWSEHDLTRTATALWWTADEFSAAATESYRATLAELAEVRERRRAALIDALIQGGGLEPGTIWDIAAKLGLPRDGLFVVVAAEAGEIGTDVLPGVTARLREESVESVWRLLPRLQVGVLSLPGSAGADAVDVVLAVLNALGTSARVGLSPTYTDLADTPRGYYLAKITLNSIGGPVVPGQPRVQRFAATPLATLVAAAPEAAVEIAHTVLGTLLELPRDDQDVLLATLEAWITSGGSARETARLLYCHPNTVRHRLHRITEHTGRSPDHPADAVELSAALHALRLLPNIRGF
jgi:hypothetical protein